LPLPTPPEAVAPNLSVPAAEALLGASASPDAKSLHTPHLKVRDTGPTGRAASRFAATLRRGSAQPQHARPEVQRSRANPHEVDAGVRRTALVVTPVPRPALLYGLRVTALQQPHEPAAGVVHPDLRVPAPRQRAAQ